MYKLSRGERMHSTIETAKAVAKFLETRWKTSGCNLCGHEKWTDGGAVTLVTAERASTVWDSILPCYALVCSNCGNTVLINSIIAGIQKPSPSATGRAVGDSPKPTTDVGT